MYLSELKGLGSCPLLTEACVFVNVAIILTSPVPLEHSLAVNDMEKSQ